MMKAFSGKYQGIKYLLTHPHQLKWVLNREIYFSRREESKKNWVEWQKYDSYDHVYWVSKYAEITAKLNEARIQTISEWVNHLGSCLRVLDVGSGDGAVGERIFLMGNNVVSIDLPKIASLTHRRRVLSVVACDAETLSFASDSFDLILALEVAEHLWNPNDFWDEARRVLKGEGHLIMSCPEGIRGLDYDSHKHYFTLENLEQKLGSRFTVREVKRLRMVGFNAPMIILLLRRT